jgi:hypothetical protein
MVIFRGFILLGLLALSQMKLIGDDGGKVSGEVFIVTAGGENIKLGRVQVVALKPEDVGTAIVAVDKKYAEADVFVNSELDKANAAVKAATDAVSSSSLDGLDAAEKQRDDADTALQNWSEASAYLRGAYKYFLNLPTQITSAKTDSDGKYALKLPDKSPVVIGAQASRKVGDDTEFGISHLGSCS